MSTLYKCDTLYMLDVCPYRDLKPENLLYSDYDEAKAVLKLADFGLAQLLNDKVSVAQH